MGVELEYAAFPHGLYWDIMDEALKEHPDPDPPTVTIDVLDGTEEMPDTKDPAYLGAMAKARRVRGDKVGNAALDLCVRVVGGIEQYEGDIEKAARYTKGDPPPDDPDERKTWFLAKVGLRTPEDWKLVGKIQTFSQIEDEEVSRKVDSFQGDVEGPEGA